MNEGDPFSVFTQADLAHLRRAVGLLESPGLFIRVANWIGAPVEAGMKKLPAKALGVIQDATMMALDKALDCALMTLDPDCRDESFDWWHKVGVVATGGLGGFFGLAGLVVELPISTGIMLRSIADVARSEGEDLRRIESRLACLMVFALGRPSEGTEASQSAYLLTRALLAKEIARAVEFLGERGFVKGEAPVLVRLVTGIAERFGLAVDEKVAAEALPMVGAVGGATINYFFMDHFQDMARGHFIYRRLERAYGEEPVKVAYLAILAERLQSSPGV